MNLLRQMVRLAHENKNLRPHLLPLIKEAHEIETRYFHVSNSGLTVTVEDNGLGPEVVVSPRSIGMDSQIRTIVEPEVLFQLAEMFRAAFEQGSWSKMYSDAAKVDSNYKTSTE